MPLDDKTLTLLSLAARDHALDEVSTTLTHKLTGIPMNDNPIQLQLQNISAERFAIAARRAAILGGGHFTPPSAAGAAALQNAINNVHAAVVASADATTLVTLTTQLLNQYGTANSK